MIFLWGKGPMRTKVPRAHKSHNAILCSCNIILSDDSVVITYFIQPIPNCSTFGLFHSCGWNKNDKLNILCSKFLDIAMLIFLELLALAHLVFCGYVFPRPLKVRGTWCLLHGKERLGLVVQSLHTQNKWRVRFSMVGHWMKFSCLLFFFPTNHRP